VNRLAGDALQGCLDLLGQGSVLVVYDNDSVFAHGGADVAALALEHVNAAGDFGDLDLNFTEVPGLR